MTKVLPATEEIEITVAAMTMDRRMSFRPEVDMVRAGLLYGDKVTLFSLDGDAFDKLQGIIDSDEDGLIDFVIRDASETGSDGLADLQANLRKYQELRSKRDCSRAESLHVAHVRSTLKKIRQQLCKNRDRLLKETGADKLHDLVRTGLVTVRTIDTGTPWKYQPGVPQYLNAIVEHLAKGRTYPMLNPRVTNLLAPSLASKEVVLLDDTVDRSKRSSLAANLLFRLPHLENVDGSAILSIRKELSRPLLRFRAAIIRFSQEVETAPWCEGFDREVQLLYDSQVVPALLDIEAAAEGSSWLSELLSASSKSWSIPAASAVGLMLAKADAVPSVLVAGLSVAVGAGILANDFIRKWKAAQASIQRNQLFYYWKLLHR